MVFFIIPASLTFSQVLGFSGASSGLVQWALGFKPIVKAVSFDPICFGTLMMMCMVIGALSPPFGLQLFVMMGVGPKGTTLGEVAWAAVPYMTCQVILMALIIAFPFIATWLPQLTQ